MPISVPCACGKTLIAPDELAGRRAKCPACKAPLTVPQRTSAPSTAVTSRTAARSAGRPAAAPAAPSGQAVRFACSCGKSMQALAAYAGRLARCPACGENVIIPSADTRSAAVRPDRPPPSPKKAPPPAEVADYEEVEEIEEIEEVQEVEEYDDVQWVEERPSKRKAAAPAGDDDFDEDDEDDEDDYEDERPRKPKRGKPRSVKKGGGGGVLLWVSLTFVLLLLLGGGGALAWWLYPAPSVTDDMVFVAGDARGVVSVRLGEVVESTVGKKLISQMPPQLRSGFFLPDSTLQIKTEDLERLTVVLADGGNPDSVWAIFRTKKPYDKSAILKNLGTTTELQQQGKTYYKSSNGGQSIHFAGPNIVVTGSENAVKKALSLPPGRSAGTFAPVLDMVDAKRHFVAALEVTPDMVQFPKMLAGGGGFGGPPGFGGPKAGPAGPGAAKANAAAKQMDAIFSLQSLTAVADTGESLDIEVTATYADDAAATAAKQGLDQTLTPLKALLPMMAMGGGKQGKDSQDMMARMKALLDGIQFVQGGPTVNLKLSLDSATLDDFAQFGKAGPGMMAGQPQLPNGPPGAMRPPKGKGAPVAPQLPGARRPTR